MNTRAILCAAAALAGCGSGALGPVGPVTGGDDWAPAFAGVWYGAITLKEAGQADVHRTGAFELVLAGHNDLVVANFCRETGGPHLFPQSAGKAAAQAASCAAVAVTGCAAVTASVSGGTGSVSGDTITLHFDANESGCGQSYPYTIDFVGTHTPPVTTPPNAAFTVLPSTTVAPGTTVHLDGSGSSDPAGQPLTYVWTLQAPYGSHAQLSSPVSPSPSFVADAAGQYYISLIVTAGSRSSAAAQSTVVAQAITPPVASIKAISAVVPGAVVALDASGSTGVGSLTFAWTLSSSPAGSAAQLNDAAASIAHLTPDLEGSYTVAVTVTASGLTSNATATFAARTAVTDALAFRPVTARYSKPLDRVVAISSAPPLLHLLDPVTKADVEIALPLAPLCLSVSSDGLFAAVGHDAWVSYVDLTTASIIKTWPISAVSGSIVLGGPLTIGGTKTRFAYVFPSRDQWVAIHDLDLVSGVEKTSGGFVYAGDVGVEQPGTGAIFAVTLGLSPQQLYRFDIDPATGLTNGGTGSPYWGDYYIGSGLFVSGDGSQLLGASGNRFRSSDMTYAGKTSEAPIAWADWSKTQARWVVQPAVNPYPYPGSPAMDDLHFTTLDDQYLASPVTTALPSFSHGGHAYDLHGRFVFYDSAGTHVIVLAQVDTAAGALNDYVVLRY